mmetsp:Transcript_10516/g.25679  ORF Transcript_10516/g.25679 Transcript_10516/m.25679 type:complete len:184 (+) Transcript_10516:146-697(+)
MLKNPVVFFYPYHLFDCVFFKAAFLALFAYQAADMAGRIALYRQNKKWKGFYQFFGGFAALTLGNMWAYHALRVVCNIDIMPQSTNATAFHALALVTEGVPVPVPRNRTLKTSTLPVRQRATAFLFGEENGESDSIAGAVGHERNARGGQRLLGSWTSRREKQKPVPDAGSGLATMYTIPNFF